MFYCADMGKNSFKFDKEKKECFQSFGETVRNLSERIKERYRLSGKRVLVWYSGISNEQYEYAVRQFRDIRLMILFVPEPNNDCKNRIPIPTS